MYIIQWNVNGFNKRKHEVFNLLQKYKPDILCLTETKLSYKSIGPKGQFRINKETGQLYDQEVYTHFPEYHQSHNISPDGRAGISIIFKIQLKNIVFDYHGSTSTSFGLPLHDLKKMSKMQVGDRRSIHANHALQNSVGRFIQASTTNDKKIIFLYVPNSGRKLVSLDRRLKWNQQLSKYLQKLKKLFLVVGDLNVVDQETDIYSMKNKKKVAGCTDEERHDYWKFKEDLGLIDCFRTIHPKQQRFTYCSYQVGGLSNINKYGYRLDYFIIQQQYADLLQDAGMLTDSVTSDHLPIFLQLKIQSLSI